MAKEIENSTVAADISVESRARTPQAQRALDEAAGRRRARDAAAEQRPTEINGREGPDPARYGDWETKGIASDF